MIMGTRRGTLLWGFSRAGRAGTFYVFLSSRVHRSRSVSATSLFPKPGSQRRTFMRWIKSLVLSTVVIAILVAATPRKTAAPRADWKDVEQALGRAGSLQPGDVYKVAFPRSDLTVTADDVTIKPALALGSWAAFKESGGQTMAMGDLVLLESEVNPVIDALQKGGIEQSALHN